ncbi:LOW QUALITY PROTEIN: zinc finger and BTB domain-containing protein 25 [Boleophthalmus pectinirostris]|uniref:LOW QUALITY PROTEIN: zinc finger and BTB domain-containing protein 25 n=1 Tax=Boleophthalmus pectinirostris TaxID=150288 RepID=UPI00242B158A|nr:LOW QUALITY PROTEIN: zinc finger and BTB domain-containing protein 25 [Boleophthalmus pectinirostris]
MRARTGGGRARGGGGGVCLRLMCLHGNGTKPEMEAHSLLLLQQLNVQREFGFLCDCTVAIGNVFFKAHRAVLAAFSNYFKMIFIHQSSECIKIQPSDIQPDVFSYLLHVMYTGMSPKQPVDQTRLQEGIRFLHAYQLCARRPHEPADQRPQRPRRPRPQRPRPPKTTPPPHATAANEDLRQSNLYGIQISSQISGAKEVCASSSVSRGRPPSGGGGPLSLCAEEERPLCSVASGVEPSTRIKEEPDDELDPGCLQEALRQSQALANQLAAQLRRSREGEGLCHAPDSEERLSPAPSMRKRKIACAVCSLRFPHKSALQEHMYVHTGKPRLHPRYGRCTGPAHPDPAHMDSGGGASNGSSYSLDSEASQESAVEGAV